VLRGVRPARNQLQYFTVLVEAPPLAPQGLAPREDHVHREPVEPGAERRFAAKRVQLLPRPDENVLRDVVGIGAIQHAAHQTVNARDVRPIQPFESPAVTTLCERYVRRFRVHRRRDRISAQGRHSRTW